MRIRTLGVQEVKKPTCEQVDNVRRLILTLEKVAVEYPEHFDMSYFVSVKYNADPLPITEQEQHKDRVELHREGVHPRECGTTGCALGWLPYTTGIPVPLVDGSEDWQGYAADVLGIYSMQWYHYCFLDWDGEDEAEGESGAIAAANRLREWLTLHEGDCVQ